MKGQKVIWKMQNKRLIAVIGPSGCGKSSLVKSALETYGSFLNKVQMVTTRPKRSDDEDYVFMTADEFARALLQGELAEAQFFNGSWAYGSLKESYSDSKTNIGVFNPEALDILLDEMSDLSEVTVIYVRRDARDRLISCLSREQYPDIDEVFRRYKADEKDFRAFEYSDWDFIPFVNRDLTWEEAKEKFNDLIYSLVVKPNIKS